MHSTERGRASTKYGSFANRPASSAASNITGSWVLSTYDSSDLGTRASSAGAEGSSTRALAVISRWRVSPSIKRLAISCRLAVSAHCMSSMNIASGWSGAAHAANSRPNTRRSRVSDSVSDSSGTGGCGPTISPSCGTRSTTSLPCGPRARVSRCRHLAIPSSASARMSSASSRSAWMIARYGMSRLYCSNLPVMSWPRRFTTVRSPGQDSFPARRGARRDWLGLAARAQRFSPASRRAAQAPASRPPRT